MEDNFSQRFRPVKLYYNSCSPSKATNKPPIILIHGMFGTSITWNRVKFQICEKTRRKVYSLDLRNHGKSEYSNEFTVDHMISDLLQFFADEKIERAAIISHSLGGRMAMKFAFKMPELVEKLVIEDMTIDSIPEELRLNILTLVKSLKLFVPKLKPCVSEKDAHRIVAAMIQKYSSKLGISQQIGKTIPFYKDVKTGEFKFHFNMETIVKLLENSENIKIDFTKDPVYRGKTLFVKGGHSMFPMEKERDLMLKLFPNSEFITITKGYHVTHIESPEEYSTIVSNFILNE